MAEYYWIEYLENGDIVYHFKGTILHLYKKGIDKMLKDGLNIDEEVEKLIKD